MSRSALLREAEGLIDRMGEAPCGVNHGSSKLGVVINGNGGWIGCSGEGLTF